MADMTASSSEPEASSVQETPIRYVKTNKGLVLATEVVLSLVVLICNAVSAASWWAGTWNWKLIYLPVCATIFTAVYFVVFAMELQGKRFSATVLQWLWGDLIRAVLFSTLYLITSLITIVLMVILHLKHRHVDGAGIAGVVFSVIASLVYAYDAYTVNLQLRSIRQQNAAVGV